MSRKGLVKKVLCVTCKKPIKILKDLKKLPKELQNLKTEPTPILEIAPESEPIESSKPAALTEFVASYGKFCASCGARLIEGAQWCPECGEKIQ